MELYKKYRPKTFKAVVGQAETCKVLRTYLKKKNLPHALLFNGPSGTGKTTLARIIASKLGCDDWTMTEINAADFRGIDTVREIKGQTKKKPLHGEAKVWIVDEAHQLSSAAQNAFLKLLEDPPSYVYFMLATTTPEKLIPTIRNRCSPFELKKLTNIELTTLVDKVLLKEKLGGLDDQVLSKLLDIADGSARSCLVLLEKMLQLDDVTEQLESLEESDIQKKSIDLCRLLIKPGSRWTEVAKLLKVLSTEPEETRRHVIAYAASIMLNGGKLTDRCFLIIEAFRDNFFDSGKAGLVAASYEIYVSDKRK